MSQFSLKEHLYDIKYKNTARLTVALGSIGQKELLVVVKKLLSDKKDKNNKSKILFRQERNILSSLNHPTIERLYGSNVRAKELYLEYIEGNTLKDAISQLNSDSKMLVLGQIAEALKYLHTPTPQKETVVHADISDLNFMLKGTRAKLIDFGCSYFKESIPQSMKNMRTGHIDFMAPEKMVGGIFTEKSDVYSFGVLAYKMIYGTLPITLNLENIPTNAPTRMYLDAALDIVSNATVKPQESGKSRIDEIVMSCLKKDYTSRPSAATIHSIFYAK